MNESSPSTENNRKRPIGYIVTIIVLLAALAFFAINTFVPGVQPVKSPDFKELSEEKNAIYEDYVVTLSDLEQSQQELMSMMGQNETLDSVILARNAEIENMKSEIEGLLKSNNYTQSELTKAKGKIKELQDQNTYYVVKIDSLFTVNNMLLAENMELSDSLLVEKQTTTKLTKEKQYLEGKYELGALLETNNMYVTGVKFKNNGSEKETDNPKKLEKLKVCFDTGDNDVIEPGPVSMYLRLISPQGTTIAVQNLGSGVLTKASGDDVQYTKQFDFDYDNKSKNICIYWSQNIFDEGVYKAEVYQGGYLIGEKEFELKSGLF